MLIDFICSRLWVWIVLGAIAAFLCREYYWKYFDTGSNGYFFPMVGCGLLAIVSIVFFIIGVMSILQRMVR